MSNLFRAGTVTLLAAGLIAAASAQGGAAAAPAQVGTLKLGDKAPPIKVAKWVKGAPIQKFEPGKVYVVEFWATWCGPCKVSIPHLTELAKKYKGKATFTGVSVWEDPEATDNSFLPKVEKFVKDMGSTMDYTIAADGYDGTMAKTWMMAAGQDGIPAAFVIDQRGRVAWIGHPMADLDRVVGEVVAGKYNMQAEINKQNKQANIAKMLEPLREAMASGDHVEAQRIIDSVIKEAPEMEANLGPMKFELMLQSDEAKAQAYALKLAEGPLKNDAMALNNLAWTIVDPAENIKKRDIKTALKISLRSNELDKDNAYYVDTLAYAYFLDNQLDKAIELQEKAVQLAEKDPQMPPETKKELRDRLAEFKKKKG